MTLFYFFVESDIMLVTTANVIFTNAFENLVETELYTYTHIHTYVHIRQSTSMPFSYYLHILSVNQNKKALVIH